MKVDISIIIPIYKGRQYIPYWLDKIARNVNYLNTLHLQCELILVNDCPEEQILADDFQVCGFILKVVQSAENRGIHGARVYGMEYAEGEWIVFLDQDDRITDDYLLKQKLYIADADVVVCNGYITRFCMDVRSIIYANDDIQKRTKDLSYYISAGNPICSPGQVMIRRGTIPDFWCQNILKANGADDYFLWILMLKKGRKFVLNREKLYTHVGHATNASRDTSSMARSIQEVEHILIEGNWIDDKEKEIIENRDILNPDKFKLLDIIAIYDYWMYLEHRNQSIIDFFREHGYFKIGIYGMSYLGNRLCDLLTASDIETIFAIDQHADGLVCNIPVFPLEAVQTGNYMKQVDVIVVTAEAAFKSIRKEIGKRYEVEVLSFKSILLEMIKKMEKEDK